MSNLDMFSAQVTNELRFIGLGSIPSKSGDLTGIMVKCGTNCLAYGIMTDNVNVQLCVVTNRKPKNVAGMTIYHISARNSDNHIPARNSDETFHYCCVNGNYTTKPTCNFSDATNYSYLIGTDGNIIYGLVPEQVSAVKTIDYSTLTFGGKTVVTKALPVVTKPSPSPKISKAEVVPELNEVLEVLLQDFISNTSPYLAVPIITSNDKYMHITLPTPFAKSEKRCERTNCVSISCTDHDSDTYIATLAQIKNNWKTYKKNNFNYQLGPVADVLHGAFIDHYKYGKDVDWGKVMRAALLVMKSGEAFTIDC